MIIRNTLVAFALTVFMSCGSESVTPLEYPAKFEYSTSTISVLKTFKVVGDSFVEVEPNERYRELILNYGNPIALSNSDIAELFPSIIGAELVSQDSLRVFFKTEPELELILIPYLRDESRIYFEDTQHDPCAWEFTINENEDRLTFSYGMSLYYEGNNFAIITEACNSADHELVLQTTIENQNVTADTISILIYGDNFDLVEQ